MASTATIRMLRNRFPQIKRQLEAEGEVVVTERGAPKYRLTLYTPIRHRRVPPSKDYMARLRRHQPRALSATAAKTLHDDNRGDR